MTHICDSKLSIIGSDNGLSPGRRQAIIWTNARMLLIWPLETNFIEILIEIRAFSFKKMHLKTSSANGRPFCLDLNVLNIYIPKAMPKMNRFCLKLFTRNTEEWHFKAVRTIHHMDIFMSNIVSEWKPKPTTFGIPHQTYENGCTMGTEWQKYIMSRV